MLRRAILYEEQLQKTYINSLDNLHNKYYHLDTWSNYKIDVKDNDWEQLQYVSVDKNNNIIGYLQATCDRITNSISSLCFINFSSQPNITFSKDCLKLFDFIFKIKKFNKIDWSVAVGNPAELLYDKLIKKYNGRIVGIYKEDLYTFDRELCDRKLYELMRKDYLKRCAIK